MVLGNNLFCCNGCVGDISFPAIPFLILLDFLLIDGNAYVIRYLKELVVTPPVDALLLDGPRAKGEPETVNATLSIIRIILCPVL